MPDCSNSSALKEFSPAIIAQLLRLQQRYSVDNQDLAAYLEGLSHARYINYWDYIELDTLLSLQRPLTNFPDESIFIIYHQITELYFKLCLCEYEQLGELQLPTVSEVVLHLSRINRYFKNLVDSFNVITDGMNKQQFLQFRLSLMPASGFQSVQYRLIELASTDLVNLVPEEKRSLLGNTPSQEQLMSHIYWRAGAIIEGTDDKSLTLSEFEHKYNAKLLDRARHFQHRNAWAVVQRLPEADRKHPNVTQQLQLLDVNININWPLMHYKSAVYHLKRESNYMDSTGGTNWRKYLPPKFQRRIFYPQLWTSDALENWGRGWVDEVMI